MAATQAEQAAGKTVSRRIAEVVFDGVTGNAITAHRFHAPSVADEFTLKDCVEALRDNVAAAKRGDAQTIDAMLRGQAAALDVIFQELARRAAASMDSNIVHTDAYLRMALRAQDQARRTAETLMASRNPPVMNIAHGPQQVNFGTVQPARNQQCPDLQRYSPNELLVSSDERLDARTTSAAVSTDTRVEAVVPIDRTDDR